MKRLLWVLVTGFGAALLGACGSGEVIVQAETTNVESGEAIALQDLVVQLLPFDRDQVFDSLAEAYPEPEPPIPDTLIRLQEAVAQAQAEWKTAESRWITVRDSLKQISDRMQGMSRAQPEYRRLFAEFSALEPQEQQLKRRNDAAFERFDRLQKELVTQSQQVKLRRDEWADEAFASVDSIFAALIEQTKREIVVDTTGATGVTRVPVKPGTWWVHARYDLPYTELYWNIPVEVKRGEPVQIKLSRENAEVRRKL
ncbi:MAG TPA: hypothetical protein VF212_07865 [Longimicrobiales bacterium]